VAAPLVCSLRRRTITKTKTTSKLDETLAERGESYGSFADNSAVAVRIKEACWPTALENPKFLRLSYADRAVVLNALDMIAAKISRLVTGDPLHKDSWQDISGYAELVVRHIEEKESGE